MPDDAAQTIYLSDYAPPAFLVDETKLTFQLSPERTKVISRIAFRPNPTATDRKFFLHGEDLKLIWARIDGQEIAPNVTKTGLSVDVPDGPFLWEAEVEIAPVTNTALEGLYMSNGMYCTQCEAEGFRKITYYPDRPDVLAPFTVRIEGDAPVLLSNGNLVETGDGFAVWHDPWPKPAYLFALVAGDLTALSDEFTTSEGRAVALNVYTRPGPDETKRDFAMDALKRAMRWDEEVYGRAYDLDIFNIVAVDDFNMGAMENKGLNIFNSSAVLASPETSTDGNYERIEAIIAHEYFHNWTGNRITCRDWFQLCLKEGLTVFRDQQFTADVRDAAVKRIEDVKDLRSAQFPEDAGPLAHPVRPESFVEINNFYTATVYEKGAELIGMLRTLVGPTAYDRTLALYFERHDGEAATIEDWLSVFEDTTGRDLSQFKRWYSQAGTPRVHVHESFDGGTYTIDLEQETPATPGQRDKEPLQIPVAIGLLGPNGDEVAPTQVCELTERHQSFVFEGLSARPVPSLLRGFSAPVVLVRQTPAAERAFLLANDTDPFNRWEACQSLATDCLLTMVGGAAPDLAFLDALHGTISDQAQSPAFRALVLRLPNEDDLAQELVTRGAVPDPTAIHMSRQSLRQTMAERFFDTLSGLYAANQVPGPYSPDASSAGKRALANACLSLLTRGDDGAAAGRQYAEADNMTQQIAALTALLSIGKGKAELAHFGESFADDRLVMNKWFAIQIANAAPEDAVAVTQELTAHPDFTWRNPNRFRAVFGTLAGNSAGFHDPSGAAYDLLADWLIRLDAVNPQTTARMVTAYQSLARYDAGRQAAMTSALKRIAARDGLSRDTGEMVARLLDR